MLAGPSLADPASGMVQMAAGRFDADDQRGLEEIAAIYVAASGLED